MTTLLSTRLLSTRGTTADEWLVPEAELRAAVGPVAVLAHGGVRSLEHVARMLDAGATRVVLGTGAVEEPALVSRAAARFGASTLVGAIRARTGWVYTHGGTRRTRKEALPWARQLADRGAGEILFLPLDDEGPDRLAELASSLPIGVLYAGPVGGDPVAASRAGAVGVLVGEAEVAAARHALRREATAR